MTNSADEANGPQGDWHGVPNNVLEKFRSLGAVKLCYDPITPSVYYFWDISDREIGYWIITFNPVILAPHYREWDELLKKQYHFVWLP